MYKIRELRKRKNLNQAEVAKLLGTTQQQYSKMEAGRSDIPGKKLILLAEFYNVSVDYILGLTDEPKPLK